MSTRRCTGSWIGEGLRAQAVLDCLGGTLSGIACLRADVPSSHLVGRGPSVSHSLVVLDASNRLPVDVSGVRSKCRHSRTVTFGVSAVTSRGSHVHSRPSPDGGTAPIRPRFARASLLDSTRCTGEGLARLENRHFTMPAFPGARFARWTPGAPVEAAPGQRSLSSVARWVICSPRSAFFGQ